MYSLADYGQMIAEPIRRRAYVEALEEAIRPGCTVLEIGTGPGIFALLAARLGAGKVIAIEPGESIELARQLVEIHGLSQRVELVQGLSTDVTLTERADVIVSDLRGVLPLYGAHLPAIVDARERLLAPGGQLIPREDSLWASLVTAEDAYRNLTGGWRDHGLDLDLTVPLEIATQSLAKLRATTEQCLVEPRRWAVLDYPTIDQPNVSGRLKWTVSDAGMAHGVAVWFDTRLSSRAGFSNAPGQPELIYGQLLLPFSSPVELAVGTTIELALSAVRVGEDYVWRWTTDFETLGGARTRFDQSTFHGLPISPQRLRKRAASHVPELSADGRIARFVLSEMDGETSLETIARRLRDAFPERFEHWRDALTRVGDLAELHA